VKPGVGGPVCSSFLVAGPKLDGNGLPIVNQPQPCGFESLSVVVIDAAHPIRHRVAVAL